MIMLNNPKSRYRYLLGYILCNRSYVKYFVSRSSLDRFISSKKLVTYYINRV